MRGSSLTPSDPSIFNPISFRTLLHLADPDTDTFVHIEILQFVDVL